MTLTLGEASGVYYGSRKFWLKLFERFGLSKAKLTIKSLEFKPSSDPEKVVAKVVVAKVPVTCQFAPLSPLFCRLHIPKP